MRALLNAAKTGLAEIRRHKLRSALSFMSIAVGSVVFMDSFASIISVNDRLREQRRISGVARMEISPNYDQVFSDPDDYKPPPVIKYEDARRLRSELPEAYMVSAESGSEINVLEYGGRRMVARVNGVTPEWAKRDFTYGLKGRFLDWNDVEKNLRVCVLFRKAAPPPMNDFEKTQAKRWDYTRAFDDMVSRNDMLGRTLKLNDFTFTVVGVLQEPPDSERPSLILTGDRDYNVLAPVTTMGRYGFLNEEWNSVTIKVDAGDERAYYGTLRRVENFLRARFGAVEFFDIDKQMETINDTIAASVKNALMAMSLGMLAFIAGGIGIMNVTLATVFSRVKEIGVRRALGASRGDIMLQFIVEAAMLGLIGGLIGSAAGYLWGVHVKVMFGMDASPIRFWMPGVSVGIAVLTAFVFAVYPAWVAAGLKPADALRTE